MPKSHRVNLRIIIPLLGLLVPLAAVSCSTLPAAAPSPGATDATPNGTLLAPAHTEPGCFEAREILPFAWLQDTSGILLRSATGVQAIDLKSGRELFFVASPTPVVSAALSPDGRTMARSLQDGEIQILQLEGQRMLAAFQAHQDPAYDLAFGPAGDRLYSVSHDGMVKSWDLSGKQVGSIHAGGEVLGIGVSPDGRLLATVPFDGPVQLWNLATGTKEADLGGTSGYDTSDARFSADGLYLASDLATGLFLWRVSDGQLLWNAVKNSMAVAYSPDGQYLAYSDIDAGNAVVLAPPDGSSVIRTIDRMDAPIWEMFFSPDSSLLLATDGTAIRIWEIPGGTLRYLGQLACP